MDKFTIILLIFFCIVLSIILINYNKQSQNCNDVVNLEYNKKEHFDSPYPKGSNIATDPFADNKPGYGIYMSNPDDSIHNKNLVDQNEHIVTSRNKSTDDYNRLVYPNDNDDVVPYGDTNCKLQNKMDQLDYAPNYNVSTNRIKNGINTDNPDEFNGNKISISDEKQREGDYKNSACPNKSLNELHKHGDTYYKNGSVCHQKSSTTQMTSSFPYNEPIVHGYNTKGEDITETPIDPAEFYKNIYKPRKANLEDERFKGWNYNNFEDKGAPADVGYIPLGKTNDFPVGANFAFK